MYGYIYKTTNLINGKIYIGQHKWDKNHLDENYIGSGKLLNAAIDKYGADKFKVDLIEFCDSLDKLNEREIYWISYYNSTNRQIGYNIATGGNSGQCNIDYIWINNGEIERQIYKSNLIPQGYIKGRLPFSDEHIIKICSMDKSYMRGVSNPMHNLEIKKKVANSLKGKNTWTKEFFWVNNGVDEQFISMNSRCPNGYVVGRLPEKDVTKTKISNKLKGKKSPTKGHKWINDGVSNKNISINDLAFYLNRGWVLGRLGNFTAWNKGKKMK